MKTKQSRVAVVKWKETEIGYLIRDLEGYLFKYDRQGVQTAKKLGFSYLIGFKNLRQVYQSKKLFAVFSSRIPSKQRRDLDKRLDTLGLEEYDEFEILLATKGKTNTDLITLEEVLDKSKIKEIMNKGISTRCDGQKRRKLIEKGEKINEK